MWSLYEKLVEGIPASGPLVTAVRSQLWTMVATNQESAGVAMFLPLGECPETEAMNSLVGKPLRRVAELATSWNFREAAVGMAAINAWYNTPANAMAMGWQEGEEETEVFEHYLPEMKGKKVAVIGRFPRLDTTVAPYCRLSVLERDPGPGDLPDSACEYLLPEQDFVFITGSAFTNKTMPRLLELSKNARIILTGPSVPLAPCLFDQAECLASSIVICPEVLANHEDTGIPPNRFHHSSRFVLLHRKK